MVINQLNFEKLIFQPELLVKVRDGVGFFPLHAIISLTNYCNHRCIWCTAYTSSKKKATNIDARQLLDFLARCRDSGLRAATYIGNGEPLLHPEFEDICRTVHSLGIEQGIFTNGSRMQRYLGVFNEYFSFVRVSLDAYSEESLRTTHGVSGHFSNIVAAIQELTRLKQSKGSRLQMGIQYVYHNVNKEGIYSAAELSKELGVDYISYKPALNRGAAVAKGNRNTLTGDQVMGEVMRARSELEDDGFKVFFREFQSKSLDKNLLKYNACLAGLFNWNLYEDGEVGICGPHRITIGSMHDVVFHLISRLRETIKILKLDACPGGCRYHSLNRLIFLLKHPAERFSLNENFI